MQDIVGIKVRDTNRGIVAFMTWGRIFHRTDPAALERAISASMKSFGLNHVVSIKVCDSLQDVAGFTYFFEALVAMCWKPIPIGKASRRKWLLRMRRSIIRGKDIHFLGSPHLKARRTRVSIPVVKKQKLGKAVTFKNQIKIDPLPGRAHQRERSGRRS